MLTNKLFYSFCMIMINDDIKLNRTEMNIVMSKICETYTSEDERI